MEGGKGGTVYSRGRARVFCLFKEPVDTITGEKRGEQIFSLFSSFETIPFPLLGEEALWVEE